MNASTGAPRPSVTQRYVALAGKTLASGEVPASRQLSLELLSRGHKSGDPLAQAHALLLLGQADVVSSNMSRAKRLGERARMLFEACEHVEGQADSLAVVSYSAGSMGDGGTGVEAAQRGVALRERLHGALAQAMGYNYLGVASFWAGDYELAEASLDAAVWVADEEPDGHAHTFQPLVNSCFLEVLKLVASDEAGVEPQLAKLVERVQWAQSLARAGKAEVLQASVNNIAHLLLMFATCVACARRGQLELAHRYFLLSRQRASTLPETSWLHAVVCWAGVELSRARRNVPAALELVNAMGEVGARSRNALAQQVAQRLKKLLGPPDE